MEHAAHTGNRWVEDALDSAVMGEVTGLLLLLAVGAIATVLVLSGVIAREAVRPPRHTAGYAVAHGLPTDPGEKDLRFESWTLELPDGAALPVWEIAVRGQGPTAVFVHGWGQSRIDVLCHIDPWIEKCARLVLYDRRGHGDATGGPARLGTGEHRDVQALLERLGDGPFLLVGEGTGAAVAIAAAAEAGPAAHVIGVVAIRPCSDVHALIRDRLGSRGLPARPLTDLAMLWLWLIGIRQGDVQHDTRSLQCPLTRHSSYPSAFRSDPM